MSDDLSDRFTDFELTVYVHQSGVRGENISQDVKIIVTSSSWLTYWLIFQTQSR